MIPKTIHIGFFWERLPDWAKLVAAEYAAMNPAFEVRIWQGLPHNLPPMVTAALGRAPDYRYRSDLVRYAILLDMGGIWVDCDTRPLNPFDDRLTGQDAFVIARGSKTDNYFMGAAPASDFMAAVVSRCLDEPSTWPYPERYFGSKNAFYDTAGNLFPGVTVVPEWCARQLVFLSELSELLPPSPPPLPPGSEYLKHYEMTGFAHVPTDTLAIPDDRLARDLLLRSVKEAKWRALNEVAAAKRREGNNGVF